MASSRTSFARTSSDFPNAPPSITVQYFYSFTKIPHLALDDPLAPAPPATAATYAPPKKPPSPFSSHDNASLDSAWNHLRVEIKRHHEHLEHRSHDSAVANRQDSGHLDSPRGLGRPGRSRGSSLGSESRVERSTRYSASLSRSPDPATIASLQLNNDDKVPKVFRARYDDDDRSKVQYQEASAGSARSSRTGSLSLKEGAEHAKGMTGKPFVRASSRSGPFITTNENVPDPAASSRPAVTQEPAESQRQRWNEEVEAKNGPTAKLPVGTARLYQAVLPDFQLEPVYWRPVNDTANIIRATWFYKETMLPVETDVANMLEAGYLNLKPWTQTWQDELNSAIEAGPVGEEKIVHPMWPKDDSKPPSSRPSTSMTTRSGDEADTPEKKRLAAEKAACDRIDSFELVGKQDGKAAGKNIYGLSGQPTHFEKCVTLYANADEAYILRPSLQPSAFSKRRPLADYVRKGLSIGVGVKRGFDRTLWEAATLPQKSGSSEASARKQQKRPLNAASENDKSKKVTDLVLVIHGIGQKLSERVESYNFTLAMNSFRRDVNAELSTGATKTLLRDDMGSIMVLPVNWRTSLSFEDQGVNGYTDAQSGSSFSLQDITPESLPSIRNIISDVMLDIPYYLSHHQPAMIRAVVTEANRIYNLWCHNNSGFEEYGKVHLIAHSLGSVMAIDILSNQPTFKSDPSILGSSPNGPHHFTFDTSNLFLAGSPAGFFLLLKHATLIPRKGRKKPVSIQGEPPAKDVAAEAGTYGCLAVDNVYNIVNPYDPVAYRLNAAVDSAYAASLKPAFLPSATRSWFSFGNPFSGRRTRDSRPPVDAGSAATATRPSLLTTSAHLPSQVELETHNFSREELAEQRAYLLNDNGQIDFLLRYGGGALEIQYLTMLSAHSSYWVSRDFVRFVVVEVGRKGGREGCCAGVKAVKGRGRGSSAE